MTNTTTCVEVKAPTDAIPVAIKVTAVTVPAPNFVAFNMTASFKKGGKQNGKKLDFDRGHGPFLLEFTLEDNTDPKLKLEFMSPSCDAMWVGPGPDCPVSAGNGGGAISYVSQSAHKLSVVNSNSVAAVMHFCLRFLGNVSDPKHPPYIFDPIIDNRGVSMVDDDRHDRISTRSIVLVAVAAVVLAVIAIFAFGMPGR